MPGSFDELLFTSASTPVYFTKSATSDDGQPVTEQAVFGSIQHPDLRTFKFLEEIRVDVAARSASSLSFGFSVDNGATYSYETRFAISAASNSSQYIAYPQLTGNYFITRISSTNGGWELRRWYGRWVDGGQAR